MRPAGLIAAAVTLALEPGGAAVAADVPSPPDLALAADQVTTLAVPFSFEVGPNAETRTVVLHYRLYLPRDYHDHPERAYPAMFMASPIGDATMGAFEERLRAERWLVAMLIESRNQSQLWMPNFLAAHDDLVRRVRVQPGMLFCTGLSGAARACSAYPGLREGFRGIILQGAGPWRGDVFAGEANRDLVVYGTFGAEDFNLPHALRIRRGLPPTVRRMVEVWDGGHDWAPAPVAERALDWVEETAFVDADLGPAASDAAWWYATVLADRFEQSGPGIARYVVAREAQAMLALHGALLDAESGTRLAQVADMAAVLAAEPGLVREVEAWEAYRTALSFEEAGDGHTLPEAEARYAAVAERLGDTEYGRLAALRAQSIGREVALLR